VVLAVSAVAVLNADRGIPVALLILLGGIAILDNGVRKTRLGRHLLAVGGNAEATLRAGIAVKRVRVIAFTLSGGLAACGGILAASRLLAVNQGSGGGDILLNAIAAAVIGGTSLFGGRGSVWSALTGALVIGIHFQRDGFAGPLVVGEIHGDGGALLLAVTLDGVARQDRATTGKAV